MDTVVTETYLERLKDVDPSLVERACAELGDQRREDYTTIVPPCPDILEIVERLEAEQVAPAVALLPPDPNEPTYRCHYCLDESSGWRPFKCPEVVCGRKREHGPHSYVARCQCWFLRNAATIRLARSRAEAKHEFVTQGMRDVEAFDDGRYPWATKL